MRASGRRAPSARPWRRLWKLSARFYERALARGFGASTAKRAGRRQAACINTTIKSMAGMDFDLLIVGAGPTGLACAIEARKAGLRAVVVEKGCIVNSIFHYPRNMVFFTTSELLEIGGLPFPTAQAKPSRAEALEYYRRAAASFDLDIRQYERIESITPRHPGFDVRSSKGRYGAGAVVIATGYYDLPNLMGIAGEDLPHVFHYFQEAHAFAGLEVAIIGGKNFAAETALDLYRHGARVTIVHRQAELGK